MENLEGEELRLHAQNLQRDVDSKAATIKHLQNAIEAKSMTIGILSKANREGGDLETYIKDAVKGKIVAAEQAAAAAKEEELRQLREQLERAAGAGAGAAEPAASGTTSQLAQLEEKLAAEREAHEALERRVVTEREDWARRERQLQEEATAERDRLEEERREAVASAEELGRRQAECDRSALGLELEELRQRLQQQEELVGKLESEKAELERSSDQDRGRLIAVRGSFEALEKVEMRAASAEVRLLQAEDSAKRSKLAAEVAEGRLEEERKLRAAMQQQLEESKEKLEELKATQLAGEGEMGQQKSQLEEERRQTAEALREMRSYQSKASELKTANDALAVQMENTIEEMQAMQLEHQGEVDELRKELRTLQGDRETQRRAVTEQIDSRLREVRQVAEREKDSLLSEQTAELRREQLRLRDVLEEKDRLRLRCDALELENAGLRDALAGEEAEAEATPSPAAAPTSTSGSSACSAPNRPDPDPEQESTSTAGGEAVASKRQAAPAGALPPAGRERVRALREQSQFAFDEMSKRIGEVREEAESEKKRLRAELDQKLHERGSQIMELTNKVDGLQTLSETLERERDALVQQRDELNRAARERERSVTSAQAELENSNEASRLLQQKLAVVMLSSTLQRSVVTPAYSLLRRDLQVTLLQGLSGQAQEAACKSGESRNYCDDDKVDASTVDGTADGDCIIEEGDEDEDEEEEEEDVEEKYRVDPTGQEEWTEMIQANTLNAMFTGADTVIESARQASSDLTEHVQNIVQSLDLFPQMYSQELQELDRSGIGKELRDFVCKHLARAMTRCQRIVSAISELCTRSDEVVGGLQNLVRVKGLEWHLTSLRVSGQYEVFLRLQKNHMAKLRSDYDDVLDQYGEQCEQNSQLQRKVEELEKHLETVRKAASTAQAQAQAQAPAQASTQGPESAATSQGAEEGKLSTTKAAQGQGGPRSMEDIHQLMRQIESSTVAEVSAKAAETGSTKGKGPPAKGKGKGPPPPGQAVGQAPTAEEGPAAAAETAGSSEAPSGGGKAKGPGPKGKKGPPPPPPAGAAAAEAAAAEAAEAATSTEAATAPEGAAAAKGKQKGKKGPPPPPGKGQGLGPQATEAEPATGETAVAAQAEAESTGEGQKGPKGPGGKGPGKKGPAGPAPPGAGGKGPAGPPGPAGGKGPAAKGAKGKGKQAERKAEPGEEPPKDMVPKQFHWTNVTGGRLDTSIFAELAEEQGQGPEASAAASAGDGGEPAGPVKEALKRARRMRLDFGALTSAFFAKKKSETGGEEASKASAKRKTVAQCLDGKKSQAVEIFLNGCGVKLEHVKGCVLELDEKAISMENLGKVRDFYPNGEELALLKAFQQDNDPSVLPWGRAEDFLISLVGIPDFKLRAESCLARGQFAEEFNGIAQDVGTLRSCLNSLVRSTSLRCIFAIVVQIGNYLNYGTRRGCQFGFTLDTLPLLLRVEGVGDKSYSLMRFLMDTLEMDRTVRDEALEDLKHCDASSKLDFEDSVKRLNELERAVSRVEETTKAGSVTDEKFIATMKTFVGDVKPKLQDLRGQVDEVVESIKKCIDLYAEKPKTPIGETLKKFADFRKDMEEARRTNLLARAKKEKAEKRKAEKSSAAKAKAEPKAASGPSGTAAAASSSSGAASATASLAGPGGAAAKGAVRKMNVKMPERPLVHTHTSRRGAGALEVPAGGSTLPRETSSGLSFGHDVHQPPERMSMGPMSRPDGLKVSTSASGRISIGVAHASGERPLGREDIQRMLAAAGAAPKAGPGPGPGPGAGAAAGAAP